MYLVIPNKRNEYFDLKKYLFSAGRPFKNAEIFYSPNYRLDKIHAQRLSVLQNVILRPVEEGRHGILKKLRDNG